LVNAPGSEGKYRALGRGAQGKLTNLNLRPEIRKKKQGAGGGSKLRVGHKGESPNYEKDSPLGSIEVGKRRTPPSGRATKW